MWKQFCFPEDLFFVFFFYIYVICNGIHVFYSYAFLRNKIVSTKLLLRFENASETDQWVFIIRNCTKFVFKLAMRSVNIPLSYTVVKASLRRGRMTSFLGCDISTVTWTDLFPRLTPENKMDRKSPVVT